MFRAADSYVQSHGNTADIPVDVVVAAATESLTTRGQAAPFNWQMAAANIRLARFVKSKQSDASTVTATAKQAPQQPVESKTQTPPQMPAPNPAPSTQKQTSPSEEKASADLSSAPQFPGHSAKSPCCSCNVRAVPQEVAPFPDAFPHSTWYKHVYPGINGAWHYLTGLLYENGVPAATAVAVPGKYGLKPPPWLSGFSLFLTADGTTQGYWICVTPMKKET